MGCEVSFSQDDLRTGFCGGAVEYEGSWRWSPSSSELASASESGVDVLACTFSRSKVWEFGAVVGSGPWPSLDDGPGLKEPELMV
jgi:hypothetical protein